MAERKAVNKYYPPDWDPTKGGINKFHGTHPLRERARKLHEGILIIRFEMSYNIWCDGCNNHIGMGVRYNAQKSNTGMYYSTPIYKFRMKCHLCDSRFEMQTDPKNLDYVILNGARRQENRWDPTTNDQVVTDERAVIKKLNTDPMFKLEHEIEDKAKAKSTEPAIQKLEEFQQRMKDDYSCNSLMRTKLRNKKKDVKLLIDKDNALLKKSSLPMNLKLLPEGKDDTKLAKLIKLESSETFEMRRNRLRRKILNGPIFSNNLKNSNNKITKFRMMTKEPIISHSKQKLSKQSLGIELKKPPLNSIVADYSDSD